MKFFVPGAVDAEEAEYLWADVRAALSDAGVPTTRRRVHALSLRPDCPRRVEVGDVTPDGDPVLIILEADGVDVFYVLTPRNLLDAAPFVLGLDEDGEAIDFDAEVVGWA